jgi:hypothetical protein
LILAQRVTQNAADNASLLPMVDPVQQRCGQPPGQTLADSGFFSIATLEQMEARQLDPYVPDSNLARSLNLGLRCRQKACAPAQRRMRRKLQTDDGKLTYGRRKAIVEPLFGVLKQQRGMRQFRTPGHRKRGQRMDPRSDGLQPHTHPCTEGELTSRRQSFSQPSSHKTARHHQNSTTNHLHLARRDVFSRRH